MPNDDDIARAAELKAEVEAKAAEFLADPSKGRAQGYEPEHKYGQSQTINSSERLKLRSDHVAWLYGVARRDLVGWRWQVDDGLNGASIMIFGRL